MTTATEAELQPEVQTETADAAKDHSDFAQLLEKTFRATTEREKDNVRGSVATLAEQLLTDSTALISDDVFSTIDALIANLDDKISGQVNEVLHHEDFQDLEGSWRGLHHLVTNSETGEQLRIKTLDISKKDLGKCLKRYKGTAYNQSPLYKRIYENELDMFGGTPYAVMIGDYYFDYSSGDVAILEGMSNIAADAHAPFIASASPEVMQLESWQELGNIKDISSKFRIPEAAAWNALRQSKNSLYLGLCMPRFLSRQPYSTKENPVEEFDFEERINGPDADQYTWSNAAYAMGMNINRAFAQYGWCTRIRGVESGGLVEGLPVHTFISDGGGVEMTCPTEIAIGGAREMELSKAGFMALQHVKNTNQAVFVGGQSLNKPQVYDDPDATANANLSARLPYLFATCRFAHYLKFIIRDKLGSNMERSDVESWLTKWINQYVAGDPQNCQEEIKAKKPLADALVIVEEDPSNPGAYQAQFKLRPHYQLESIDVTLSLVSKVTPPAA